tara:strand:+ start:827 stop:2761 length:1935 start_codon:yes stop_codon:yes gene_type:complete
MKPSRYQLDFYNEVEHGQGNVLLNATAGSGKTTSIVEALKKVPKHKKSVFLAFSKQIQLELRGKVPEHMDCMTLHSLGYKSLWGYYRAKMKVDSYKTMNSISGFVDGLRDNNQKPLSKKEKLRKKFAISDLIDMARITADTSYEGFKGAEMLYGIDTKKGDLEQAVNLFDTIHSNNKKRTKQPIIDFVDMLYIPHAFDLEMPKYDYVFLDECFPYDQKIITSNGKQKIGGVVRDFERGVKTTVLSYNEEKQIFEHKKVTNAWCRGVKDLIEITLGGKRKIKCTPNHKLLSLNGWVEAGTLSNGDILLSTSEDSNFQKLGGMVVTSIPVKIDAEVVYDIEVEDNHNFIISINDNGFIAHNCQDFSAIQHLLLDKILKKGSRIIAAGDPQQSIFSFAGAMSNSIDILKDKFGMKELPLSVTYRVPKSGVELMREYKPTVEYPNNAIEGEINRKGNLSDAKEGDLVICRLTKPLVAAYFKLLDEEKKATIVGKEMEAGLSKMLKIVNGFEVHEAEDYFISELEKLHDHLMNDNNVEDPKTHPKYTSFEEKIDILKIFFDRYGSVYDTQLKIKQIFGDSHRKAVTLMTIHKAKGLESDNVFIIKSFKGQSLFPYKREKGMSDEQKLQEKNLEYVAVSRFKKKLTFINI